MLRDLGVNQVSDVGAIEGAIRNMGQELFEPPDVKGWRGGRAWINSNRIFIRYNAIADLIRNVSRPGGQRGVDVVALLSKSNCKTEAEIVDYLARACLIKPLETQKRSELVGFLGTLPPQSQWDSQRAEVNDKLQGLLILMLR